MTEEITQLNKWLKEVYGMTPNNLPLFRLSFSETEKEMRIGTFREYSGDLFVREIIGAHKVPKYPWINSRWILEMWCPPEIALKKELPESYQGTYEPIFVFEDKNGQPLPITQKVLEVIVYGTNRGPKNTPVKTDAESLAAEIKWMEELISE